MMQCWINGPATGGIDDKIKMVNILLKTNIDNLVKIQNTRISAS